MGNNRTIHSKGRRQGVGNKDITQATPSYQLCHIVEQGDQVNDGAGRERNGQDLLSSGPSSLPRSGDKARQTVTSEKREAGWNRDIQEQAKARAPWVKLGTCCFLAQALGRFCKWLQCQGGNSDLTHETAAHGTAAHGQGRLTVCSSSRRAS